MNINSSVLVVDDDEMMREVVSMMLEAHGATVISASGGEQARAALREQPTLRYFCMDFSMPDEDGYQVYQSLRALQPEMRGVIFSGLPMVPEISKLQTQGAVRFLPKPFTESDLVTTLQKVINL